MKPEILSLETLKARYGTSTPRRQFLLERLRSVVHLLHETGQVRHIYLFGSFPTAAPRPNDIDLLVVMATGFTTDGLPDRLLGVFTHDTCRIRYSTDLYWVTETVGEEYIREILDVFSRDRAHQPQPLLEITP